MFQLFTFRAMDGEWQTDASGLMASSSRPETLDITSNHSVMTVRSGDYFERHVDQPLYTARL